MVTYCTSKYLIKTRRWKAAKSLLQESSLLFPDNLEIYLTFASLMKDMERSDEAIDILKKALSQESFNSRTRELKRKIFGQNWEAYSSNVVTIIQVSLFLKKSLRMDSEENFLHYDILGICYLLVGDHENCIFYIDKFILYNGEIDAEI